MDKPEKQATLGTQNTVSQKCENVRIPCTCEKVKKRELLLLNT